MPSTPSSPSSQRPRRRSSQTSTRTNPVSPMHSRHTSLSHRRRTSESSTRSNDGMLSPNGDFGSSIGGVTGGDGGLGNLEDELAGAWEEGEDEILEEDEEGQVGQADVARAPLSPLHTGDLAHDSSATLTLPNGKTSSPKKQRKRKDTRTSETLYDGSDYGEPDSPPNADLPPELRMLMRDVEELARQGSYLFLPSQSAHSSPPAATPQTNGGSPTKARNPPLTLPAATTSASKPPPQDAFGSLHTRLRDLGGQTTLETLTTRLITAHTSLTTHLAHQTRTLQSAAFPLLSPLAITSGTGVAPEDIEELISLVVATLDVLPQPSFTSLNSLSHLHATGKEAVSALAGLSDSLHMSRQVESAAARRLKSARECTAEMRREYDLEASGRAWIEAGGWDERLKRREAQRVCNDVTGGFEEVCEGWRRRLVESARARGEVVA